MKVKIIKDTWAHSKKCWFIVDVETNITFNYGGFTSKKAATKRALELDCEVVG